MFLATNVFQCKEYFLYSIKLALLDLKMKVVLIIYYAKKAPLLNLSAVREWFRLLFPYKNWDGKNVLR